MPGSESAIFFVDSIARQKFKTPAFSKDYFLNSKLLLLGMLENILNTKLKKRLLGIFFAFPERSFSLLEIQAMLGTKNGITNRILKDFSAAQLVNSASKKKKRYFKINPHFRLYQEIEDLVSDQEEGLEDHVVSYLKRIPNVRMAVLTGIFTLQPHLEVDLLLVGKGISRLRVQNTLNVIGKLIGEDVNYAIMDMEEFEHRQLMNDRFIRDILDNPHLEINNTNK